MQTSKYYTVYMFKYICKYKMPLKITANYACDLNSCQL